MKCRIVAREQLRSLGSWPASGGYPNSLGMAILDTIRGEGRPMRDHVA